MEAKTNKNKKITDKVKWHHARWFWGVVIIAIIVVIAAFYYIAPQNNFNSVIDLVSSIFWTTPLGIAVIILALSGTDSSLWPIILYSFRILYLLVFAFLLYKTFCNSIVKIIYPILLIIIFITSILFGILASSFT